MDLFKDSENLIAFHVERIQTLEEFLSENQISGRFLRRAYRGKNIFVNGGIAKKNELVKAGDVVSIKLENESNNIMPESIPLDIIYEDVDLLVLNKQPFMVVHQTKSHQNNTISNGVSHYFEMMGIQRKIRFVNRLDMDTSGILLVAKSSFAHQQMAIQFENNEVEKKYLVLVSGIVEKDNGTIDLPIGREEEKSIRKAVNLEGKDATTKYRVLDRYMNASLLDVQILTGRSHQIRVHLNHIGHPVIGDTLYFESSLFINRQALHSYYLKIRLPRTKRPLELCAPLPDDIESLIDYLKKPNKI